MRVQRDRTQAWKQTSKLSNKRRRDHVGLPPNEWCGAARARESVSLAWPTGTASHVDEAAGDFDALASVAGTDLSTVYSTHRHHPPGPRPSFRTST